MSRAHQLAVFLLCGVMSIFGTKNMAQDNNISLNDIGLNDIGRSDISRSDISRSDISLSDIRGELELISVQIDGLRRQVLQSNTAQSTTLSGSPLQRIDAIENLLQILVGQLEGVEFGINTSLKDLTQRMRAIEFRIIELEGGDPATLITGDGVDQTNGGLILDDSELTIAERADFEYAVSLFEQENFPNAIDEFDKFIAAYPDSPMGQSARFNRAQSLAGLDNWKAAGRGFLESFSIDPNGAIAPQALVQLGLSLAKLDKLAEACQTLFEAQARFPEHKQAGVASDEMQTLGCP